MSSRPRTKSGGRPPLSKSYRLQEVTPETIAYTACIARFCYNSQAQWNEDDDTFIGREFYDNILTLFLDDAWKAKTLAWWNKEIFGRQTRAVAPNGKEIRKRPGPSAMDRILGKRTRTTSSSEGSTPSTSVADAATVSGPSHAALATNGASAMAGSHNNDPQSGESSTPHMGEPSQVQP
ncbi:hypothetical protein WOLCODRAFT_149025 [Wolfiporia cocos MD-104 SS10]|uniref:Uncharacterized protein n=1 Tax=Wolfiporia cocos (strain MD-104) TaxID=742152 RepID=A0A2H3JH19_WOLCO|nr:hypothetical protein WOLCODRAFT_149025 [Wolfiporia cocos MD-104 SS10]